jgi:hypothetical protein
MEVIALLFLVIVQVFLFYGIYKICEIVYYSGKIDANSQLISDNLINLNYEKLKIEELESKLKNEQLKTSYYIQVINEIEIELKNQQYNNVSNLINKIKRIISSEDKFNIKKRKELIKSATNEND